MSTSNLLVLTCSARKTLGRGPLPALELYDGVNFRVLRKFLRERGWPAGLIVKVVSAKHGLLDIADILSPYEQVMTPERARELRPSMLSSLGTIGPVGAVFANLGAAYRPAVGDLEEIFADAQVHRASGGIGQKMKEMKCWLNGLQSRTATISDSSSNSPQYLYFFPDWDDYVYEPFVEVETCELKEEGHLTKSYAHELFGEEAPYDGVLVSLAQINEKKGALYRVHAEGSAGPELRESLKLPPRLFLFGDCGAFSYSGMASPPFSPVEAAELYDEHGFDIAASVDHIPLPEVTYRASDGSRKRRTLSESTRRRRIRLTIDNAEEFLGTWKRQRYSFIPMAVAHGLSPKSYGNCVSQYLEMGYKHIALGGLVPKSDSEIVEVIAAARRAIQQTSGEGQQSAWLHLFGILRPKIQATSRALGVSSFDSASYMRKAWLRSEQNYLAPSGDRWFGTLRVPISASKRMQAAARNGGISSEELQELETDCLSLIRAFDGSAKAKKDLLQAIAEYGPLLPRRGEENHFEDKHRHLLSERPWEECTCAICQAIGIQVIVFRGANRNKRRGLHNTWVFYNHFLKRAK